MSSFARGSWLSRLLAGGVLAAGLAIAAPAAVAHADPPVPTDYSSEVVSITPAIPGVGARIIGGDSFLELTVPRGTIATVAGYDGEPYLRFNADGTVEENLHSPTTYINRDRTGETPRPPEATADAEPKWHEVATDGRFAWHDHRTHWMASVRPPNMGPGDQILDQIVPIEVDGVPVEIRVVSTWEPAPSPWPAWLGAAIGGLVATAGLVAARTRPRSPAVAGLVIAGAAAVIGIWQHRSLPAQVGSPLRGWLLPLTAVIVLIPAVFVRRVAEWRPAFVLAACVQLLQWSWLRRTGLSRAVLPTSAPYWLDRAVTAGVAVAALVLVVGSVVALVRVVRSWVDAAAAPVPQ